MDNFFVSRALKYYKRREVQEAIIRHAAQREVSPRYGNGFGKRPDLLENPADVLEFAKRKATSFHCSEERWQNPMQIATGMSRKDANELRVGWDLVLDIDAQDWEIARLTAWLFLQALEQHGIGCASVKFSGNKGWHIGVPWEAFPRAIVDHEGNDILLSDLFPDMPKRIAEYLVEYIGDTRNGLVKIQEDEIVFAGRVKDNLAKIASKVGKEKKDILETYCPSCRKAVQRSGVQYGLHCQSCGSRAGKRYTQEEKAVIESDELVCRKCRHMMDFYLASRGRGCTHSPSSYQQRFKITEVIEFDTILLASRHLYRMPYSLHEKSGLSSVVIDPEDVLSFRKEMADPGAISLTKTFLDPAMTREDEAGQLVSMAWTMDEEKPAQHSEQYDVPDEAIPEEHFPPCMKRILAGLTDGRKRALFALVNFLQTVGWPPEMIRERIYAWNDANQEPLRETVIKSHLHHHLGKKEKILPPNCMQFYRELGVCFPDDLCRMIRNPTQYARKKKGMKR